MISDDFDVSICGVDDKLDFKYPVGSYSYVVS